VLVTPQNGEGAVDTSIPLSWTPVADAQAYYVYIGTSPGLNDVINSGEITRTTYSTGPLPAGVPLHVRLWTKVGGIWRFTDSSFTAAAALLPVVASFTYPTHLAVNVDIVRPFQWTSVAGAQKYYLYVGTAVGLRDVFDSGETLLTTLTIPNLPGARTLYARLWTRLGDIWRFVDIQLATAPMARPTSPAAGAEAFNPSQPFTWTPVDGAEAYYLYVGSTVGANDIVNSGELRVTSYRALALPAGQVLYARLWTKAAGFWRFVDWSFTAGMPLTAHLTFPANGATNVNLSQPLTWTPIPGASAYYVYAGTSPGAKDLVDSGEIQTTTYQAAAIVQKFPPLSVAWDPDPDDPYFTDHYAMVLDGLRTDFGWMQPRSCSTPEGTTTCFKVVLPPLQTGAHSLAISAYHPGGETASPTVAIDRPPRTVYIRLWTKLAGVWRFEDSQFTASELAARLTYPIDGAIAVDLTRPLTWSAVAMAQAYSIAVGRTPGGSEFFSVAELSGTSYLAPTLPGYEPLHVRIGTKVGDVWRYSDSTFQATPLTARLLYPADGAREFSPTDQFWWSPVPNAEAYYLYVGRAPGAKDVVNSGERAGASYRGPHLPVGIVLHARLWTKVAGVWRYVDSTFTSRSHPPTGTPPNPNLPVATLLDLADGSAIDPVTTFRWTPVDGALGYHIHVGSAPGSDDYANSPDYINDSAYTLSGLPSGRTVYVRFYTQHSVGDWSNYVDLTVTVR
jgi:hypothetical protein